MNAEHVSLMPRTIKVCSSARLVNYGSNAADQFGLRAGRCPLLA